MATTNIQLEILRKAKTAGGILADNPVTADLGLHLTKLVRQGKLEAISINGRPGYRLTAAGTTEVNAHTADTILSAGIGYALNVAVIDVPVPAPLTDAA